ncbi:MAG: HDOD domain-containing protein [Burkholderiales bacterium]|nr:HDOD domain-containing protein [Burkholderiales bacterium]
MTSNSTNDRYAVAEEWLKEHGADLPKFNSSLAGAIATLDWDGGDIHELERLISSDPATIVCTLRAANSPFFGLSKRVDSIRHALTVLGLASVRSILMRGYLADSFGIADKDRLAGEYVAHCIVSGLAARELAAKYEVPADTAYVAGVLQGVGKLMLLAYSRQQADAIYQGGNLLDSREPVEIEVLGFDHVELTVSTLKAWHLPDAMITAVDDALRNRRSSTPLTRTTLSARLVADYIDHQRFERDEDAAEVREQLVGMIGEINMTRVLKRIHDEVNEMFSWTSFLDGVES